MSDFLGHLVARTIAQPTLRPRTRSRFEAPSLEEAPLVWPEATQGVSQPQAQATPPSPTFEQTTTAADVESRPITRRNGVAPTPALPPRDASRSPEENPSRPAGEPETRVVVEHDVQRVVETNERVVPVAGPNRPHRFDEQPPRIIERRGPRELEERHNERVIHSSTDRIHRVSGKAQPLESAATPEPVIQVSIGRIEVRAATPASPARSAHRGTAMTIDDYVAKRKAKERR